MLTIPPLRRLLAAVVLASIGTGCHNQSDITVAGGKPPTSSGGLPPLNGKDQLDADHPPDPDSGLKPFPDAGVPDVAAVKEEKCAAESQAAKQVPVDLLLLVDRSGSMTYKVSAGGKSKWELAQEALITFIKDPKSAGLGVGLQYFPLVPSCMTDMDCGFPAGLGVPACIEQKACVGPSGTLVGTPIPCAARPSLCPTGTTCAPIGYCSETGAVCTNPGAACAGGLSSNRCTTSPKTCRDTINSMCKAIDYEKLAVPIGDLPVAAQSLSVSLAATSPGGGTPTDPAVEAALTQLRMRATANPGRHEVLVLVTDGQPNSCNANPIPYITGLIDAAQKATPSISTYAIGVFGVGEFGGGQATLQAWATAGGTGMPFVLTAGDDLNQKLLDALNQIRGSALPCEYDIPKPAVGALDYKKVNVHVSGTASGMAGLDLGYVASAAKCDPVKGGWYYDADPDMGGTPSRVIMCEATCKKFKMDATANIELRFGCQTNIIQ
jgi:hypothetical protein